MKRKNSQDWPDTRVFGLFLENMAKLSMQMEYDWLKKQSGVTSIYLNEMWEQYYVAQGVDEGNEEIDWLRKRIVEEGGTPSDSKFVTDLWKELLTARGLRVSKFYQENRDVYFRCMIDSSISLSVSPSASVSPSSSLSPSASESRSPSASVSPSASESPSPSV